MDWFWELLGWKVVRYPWNCVMFVRPWPESAVEQQRLLYWFDEMSRSTDNLYVTLRLR